MCSRNAHDSERQTAVPLLSFRLADVAKHLGNGTCIVVKKHKSILTGANERYGKIQARVGENQKDKMKRT
jgi:hypothetical protein